MWCLTGHQLQAKRFIFVRYLISSRRVVDHELNIWYSVKKGYSLDDTKGQGNQWVLILCNMRPSQKNVGL